MFEILNNILAITGFLGLIYSAFQWLYFNKIKFFLWFNKLFSWKRDVNFELTILSSSTLSNLDQIAKYIRNKTKVESKIISKSKDKIVFSYDTLIFQIAFDEFDENGYGLEIYIKNSNSTYKSAKLNLHRIGLILDDMEKDAIFKPSKFQFISSFKKKNPFIGPSVSTIKIDNIKQFVMVLSSSVFDRITIENDNDIQIGLNNISYVDTNYSEIKLVAEIILAF